MNRFDVLAVSSFGHRVAEEETHDLLSYFVKTDQWKRVYEGDVDVVYGVKGSGKTAIYSLLLLKTAELKGRNIEVIPAENASSDPIFSAIDSSPTEEKLRSLWKLYFARLITEHLRALGVQNSEFSQAERVLQRGRWIPYRGGTTRFFVSVVDWLKRWITPESIEGVSRSTLKPDKSKDLL